MSNARQRTPEHGPFRVEHVPEGSRYELSRGHAIYCAPAGRRHGGANLTGSLPLATDPAVREAGVDVGFAASAEQLRAPDMAVGNVSDEPGWAEGAPPLAVEYADTGQDEAELRAKIGELLAAGSRQVWVVRLTGPRRVEVHAAGQPFRVATAGDELRLEGVLQNAVPVEALFDRRAAFAATLRNLLQREGYESLSAVREEGRELGHDQGREEGLMPLARIFERRLGRTLTSAEGIALRTHLTQLGPERVGDAAVDLAPDALAAWLAGV